MTIRELLSLVLSFNYVNGKIAADLGYVNAGTDRRVGGSLGKMAGQIQSGLSFKSTTKPIKRVERLSSIWIETAEAPNGRQHISIAVRRDRTHWLTVRFGWRYDGNWGDSGTVGYNPNPEIIGGYIFDAVIKLNAPISFIEGVE